MPVTTRPDPPAIDARPDRPTAVQTPPARTAADAVTIRRATDADADQVYRLIADNQRSGHLLARTRDDVAQHVPRFLVATAADDLVGCGEVARLSGALAEVRSLVVTASRRGGGVGQRLLDALIAEAAAERFPRICAFTHQAAPFVRAGFSIVPHPWLPEKIDADCRTCDLFRRCHQYAVVLDLERRPGSAR